MVENNLERIVNDTDNTCLNSQGYDILVIGVNTDKESVSCQIVEKIVKGVSGLPRLPVKNLYLCRRKLEELNSLKEELDDWKEDQLLGIPIIEKVSYEGIKNLLLERPPDLTIFSLEGYPNFIQAVREGKAKYITREILLSYNLPPVQEYAEKFKKEGDFEYEGFVLMVTNPVDILSYAFWQNSKVPYSKIAGFNDIDSITFRRVIFKMLNKKPEELRGLNLNQKAFVFGPHSSEALPIFSWLGKDTFTQLTEVNYLQKINEKYRCSPEQIFTEDERTDWFGKPPQFKKIIRKLINYERFRWLQNYKKYAPDVAEGVIKTLYHLLRQDKSYTPSLSILNHTEGKEPVFSGCPVEVKYDNKFGFFVEPSEEHSLGKLDSEEKSALDKEVIPHLKEMISSLEKGEFKGDKEQYKKAELEELLDKDGFVLEAPDRTEKKTSTAGGRARRLKIKGEEIKIQQPAPPGLLEGQVIILADHYTARLFKCNSTLKEEHKIDFEHTVRSLLVYQNETGEVLLVSGHYDGLKQTPLSDPTKQIIYGLSNIDRTEKIQEIIRLEDKFIARHPGLGLCEFKVEGRNNPERRGKVLDFGDAAEIHSLKEHEGFGYLAEESRLWRFWYNSEGKLSYEPFGIGERIASYCFDLDGTIKIGSVGGKIISLKEERMKEKSKNWLVEENRQVFSLENSTRIEDLQTVPFENYWLGFIAGGNLCLLYKQAMYTNDVLFSKLADFGGRENSVYGLKYPQPNLSRLKTFSLLPPSNLLLIIENSQLNEQNELEIRSELRLLDLPARREISCLPDLSGKIYDIKIFGG